MTKKKHTSDQLEFDACGSKLLEDSEKKLEILRELLIQGEESGVADYDFENLIAELDKTT